MLARLPAASIDLVVTDPPYLVRYVSSDGRRVPESDDPRFMRRAFAEVARVLKPDRFAVSFYGWSRAHVFLEAWRAAGLRPVGHFVWAKRYVSSEGYTRRAHENAYLLAKGYPAAPRTSPRDILAGRFTGNVLHPTQKPAAVLRPLIAAYSARGEVVLDPFAGSGTTAVAARALGRHYIGIELDPTYARIARERLDGARRE